jgi:hypothetical protein
MKLHPSVQSLLNEIEDFLDRTGETPDRVRHRGAERWPVSAAAEKGPGAVDRHRRESPRLHAPRRKGVGMMIRFSPASEFPRVPRSGNNPAAASSPAVSPRESAAGNSSSNYPGRGFPVGRREGRFHRKIACGPAWVGASRNISTVQGDRLSHQFSVFRPARGVQKRPGLANAVRHTLHLRRRAARPAVRAVDLRRLFHPVFGWH